MRISSNLPASDSVRPSLRRRREEPKSTTLMLPFFLNISIIYYLRNPLQRYSKILNSIIRNSQFYYTKFSIHPCEILHVNLAILGLLATKFGQDISLEPPFVHRLQKLRGDGDADGVAYHGIDVAVGTKGGRFLVGDIVGDFGRQEYPSTVEATALLRFLQ